MKIIAIGASGHVGSYLVKELVKEGHEVVAVMRGSRVPYGYKQSIWDKVKVVNISRQDLYESDLAH